MNRVVIILQLIIKFNLYHDLVCNTSRFSSILSIVSPNNNYNKIDWKIKI